MSGAPCLHRWRGVLGLVRGQITPYVRWRLAEVMGLVLLGAVANALAPLVLKIIVDALTGQRGTVLSGEILVGLYAAMQWLSRSSTEVQALRYACAERRMLRTLHARLFSHVLSLPLRFHLRRQSGAVSQTIDNGLQGLRLILHQVVFTVVPVGVELAVAAGVLMRFVRPLFLVLFCIAAICYAWLFGRSAARIADSARAAAAAGVEAGAIITDGLLNYEAVKCFGAERLIAAKATGALGRSERTWLAFYRHYSGNGLAVAAVFAVFLAASLLCALHSVRAGRLTVGGFVLVNAYMMQLVRPAELLGAAAQGVAQGTALLEGAMQLLTEPAEPLAGVPLRRGQCGALEFERVTLSYEPGRAALREVSFSLSPGATVAIVGQSGSGKSSIVRLLLRLLEPDAGVIRLDGVPIECIAPDALRAAIALVPQDPVLFDDTIAYNILVAAPNASHEELERAVRLAQLGEFIGSLPQGYETVVGERGVRLSGGERQRIAIARAALRRPLIYVFDEATAALDSHTEQAILSNLRAVSANATTLIVAHRLSSVMHAGGILVLHRGRLVESGTHEQLLRAQGHYAALWSAQVASPTAA